MDAKASARSSGAKLVDVSKVAGEVCYVFSDGHVIQNGSYPIR